MKIPTGRFVWFDYVAPDEAKAKGFFGELFGWKARSVPTPDGRTYTMFTVHDQMIGGYIKTPKGAPEVGHWLSHLQVADVKAASDKVVALGGKVHKPAEKMGEYGTMAIVADPLGGSFALWQPAKAEGTGDFTDLPNTFCWNELYTADPGKSVAFYSALAGFTEQQMPMPTGTYHVLNFEGKGRAGVVKPPQPMIQAWMPYVHVADVDQTLAQATRLGGTVHVPGHDVPGVGRIGIFTDNQNGWLGLLAPAR